MKKSILFSALDWGLGHASRSIPIIRQLQQHAIVYIAANKNQIAFFEKEVKDVEFIYHKGYKISYSSRNEQISSLLFQVPKLLNRIYTEKKETETLVRKTNAALIVSDNRWGFYSNLTPSVFISHQLTIPAPILKSFINKINALLINKFTECWVPDEETENELCFDMNKNENIQIPVRTIGWLSRFEKLQQSAINATFDSLFLISGPEPQRSIFEKIAISICKENPNLKFALLRGLPGNIEDLSSIQNVKKISHLSSQELFDLIKSSKIVISRSGYSTIMDLLHTGGKAIFVPTPGQPEQYLLAKKISTDKIAPYISQIDLKNINIEESINNYSGFEGGYYNYKLKNVVNDFIQQQQLF